MAEKDNNGLQENGKKTLKQKLKEAFPGLDRTYPRRAREIGRIKDVYNGPEQYAAVYAGPDYFDKKTKEAKPSPISGVYAGPDQMQGPAPEVPIMEDVYAGPPDLNAEDDEPEGSKRPMRLVYAGPDQMKKNRTGRVYAGPDRMPLNRSRMAPVYAGPEAPPAPIMTPEDKPQSAETEPPVMFVYAGPQQMSQMMNSTMLAYAGPQQINDQVRSGQDLPPWMNQTMTVYAGPDYFNPNKPNGPAVIAADGAAPGPAPQTDGFVPTDGLANEVTEDDKTYVICGCCGSKLENPGKFCPECGALIKKAPAPVENA